MHLTKEWSNKSAFVKLSVILKVPFNLKKNVFSLLWEVELKWLEKKNQLNMEVRFHLCFRFYNKYGGSGACWEC